MLKKNLFKKVSSAVLAMCFLVCLDFGCLAMYLNADKNLINEKTIETDICSDEEVPSFLDYDDGFENDKDENNQNELNDKKSTKNYFKARTPEISKVVLKGQSKADVYSDEAVLPLGSEEENE